MASTLGSPERLRSGRDAEQRPLRPDVGDAEPGGWLLEGRDRLFTPDPERNSPSYVDSGYTFVAVCNGPGAQLAYMKTLALIERRK